MNFCEDINVLNVFKIVNTVVTIIKIVVPIVLIVMVSIDYLNAVKTKEADAISKANKKVVPRAIAAVLVFMVPTFGMMIAELFSVYSDGITNCFVNANNEYIDETIVSNARIYLKFAKQSLKRSDYNLAIHEINRIKDNKTRKALKKEAAQIDKAIKAKEQEAGEEVLIIPGTSGNVENSLGIYYYNQCDRRWKNRKYDISGATLCDSSCGYTSFAMIAAGLNNDSSINPYTVIKYFRNIKSGQLSRRGYGAASWNEIANNKKISYYNLKCDTIRKTQITSYLKAGRPVIVLVPGHYVVLSYSNNGKIVLMDPFTNWASKKKKSGEYNSISDIEKAYGNIRKAVAYTKL